ncbi:hypothetical protein EVAR_12827_1 [Eumeta japonica]|uniref:Uncharacterized protein n=1 Tax=Eumeta variegata TaxID=151549 RepID=A0A4C1UAU8_EUMVA|nr:hypothetical protein EVAR_12827_1 [Eumeta japonica]
MTNHLIRRSSQADLKFQIRPETSNVIRLRQSVALPEDRRHWTRLLLDDRPAGWSVTKLSASVRLFDHDVATDLRNGREGALAQGQQIGPRPDRLRPAPRGLMTRGRAVALLLPPFANFAYCYIFRFRLLGYRNWTWIETEERI